MRPNPSRAFAFFLAVVCCSLLWTPILALADNSPLPPYTATATSAVAVQGASPQESPKQMPEPRAVLRLVVCRKPVAFCQFPERQDALDFLGAYVVETLECGHSVHQFFNPPIESLIAKRRRCRECEDAEKIVAITAGKKKPPVSVGMPAAGRKRVLL